jgi:hypothetical protein
LCAALAAGALAAPAADAAGWTPYDRPATYGIVTEHDVPITMRDGTILAANVERPDRPGRYPVLVIQTPYNKDGVVNQALGGQAAYMVQRGYVVLTVDVRGTGGSQGIWDSFGEAEQRDGYDVVEWAAQQSWSDGNVGLTGPSYMGLNQLLTAALHPPHLKAIFPIVPMADGYRDITFSGGDINVSFIPFWLGLVTAGSLTPPSYALSGNPNDLVRSLGALASHAAGAVNFQLNTLLAGATGGDVAYDGPFWKTRSPLEVVDKINVPAFVTGGLHDLFQRGEPLIYERLKQHVFARLLMGPWTHVGAGTGLPRDGVPSLSQIELRWFDHWLKGIDTHLDQIPAVTQYTYGDERYETQADWPDPKLDPRRIYLRGSGALSNSAPSTAETPQNFTQQPLSGICTQSTDQWTAGLLAGIPCDTDNRLNEALGDAVYTTPVLGQPLRISGPILADLWITTTAKDAAVTVRLTDVDPSGKSTELTDGWLAASLRAVDATRSRTIRGMLVQPWHPFTRDSVLPVVAGQPTELAVEVFPTNVVILKGHRLRMTVGPSDFPHQLPPLPQLLNGLGGQVQVLTDPSHASSVTLPELGATCAVPASAAVKTTIKKKHHKKRRKAKHTAKHAAKPVRHAATLAACPSLPLAQLVRG